MNVLIADDDPVTRRLLRGHLEKWGHTVTEAAGGGEAWRMFEAAPCPLVISDWGMPELDGPELVRRIRACDRPGYVYVMLLTARSQKEDVVYGMEAGADDFITKPFDREELRARLRAGERIVRLEQALADQNRALREAQAALVQQEKLAGLGRLAAGVAHEINNPLAYAKNNLAVLRRDTRSALAALAAYRAGDAAAGARLEREADVAYFEANLDRTCDAALGGMRRVGDIVRNLRDFARLDEAEFQEIDLNAALASTLEVLSHEASTHGVRVTSDFGPLPPVPGRPGKLNQVFLHLLTNAIEACAAGGTVAVRTWTDGAAIVEVRDDGAGIAPEHRARLFEPFFTTKPIGTGTGLGLSVSYGIVRDHGGTIDVDSAPGRGSTFRIQLPIQNPKHEIRNSKSEPVPTPSA